MRKSLFCLALFCSHLDADVDSFRERFADPGTRNAAIAELIPGTRDAYFHIALDHQLAGRDVEFRKTMSEWEAASVRSQNPISADGYKVLENRQLLLAYQKDPNTSLAELIRRFHLTFNDTRPDAAAAENLPTVVDPALISLAAFEKAAADQSKDTPYTHYQNHRLILELDQVAKFDERKIRWFLHKIDRADLPGVVPLIDRSLSFQNPVVFGTVPLHHQLTALQLDELSKQHPELLADADFNIARLSKQRPCAETDLSRDPNALAHHLQLCRDYAVTSERNLGKPDRMAIFEFPKFSHAHQHDKQFFSSHRST